MSLKVPKIEYSKCKVLFDGDEIVYKCGFSVEEREYLVKQYDKVLYTSKYKREVDKWIKDNKPDPKGLEIQKNVEVNPVEHAYNSVNFFINSHLQELKAIDYKVYLSGKDNFRYKVATLAPYKGNRDNNHKPVHMDEIRGFIVSNHNGIIVDGMEADDAIGIEAYKDFMDNEGLSEKVKTIVCSQDKDMLMIPGWNYNPNNNKLTWINLDKAERNFWKQVLTGDTSDNIPGITGIGEVTAKRLLDGLVESPEIQYAVLREYLNYYNGDRDKALDHIEETCKLLWILRELGVTWNGTRI